MSKFNKKFSSRVHKGFEVAQVEILNLFETRYNLILQSVYTKILTYIEIRKSNSTYYYMEDSRLIAISNEVIYLQIKVSFFTMLYDYFYIFLGSVIKMLIKSVDKCIYLV